MGFLPHNLFFPPARMKCGITLIEILIIIAVALTILTLTTNGLITFKRTSLLNAAGETVVSVLFDARAKTLSSRDASVYGVHLASDRVISFKGAIYTSGDPANEETMLPAEMEISSFSLSGGGADLVFDRLTGATSRYGTVTLRLKSDGRTRTISILQTGVISIQ